MQKEKGYRPNAEADSLLPVADPDIASLENSVLYIVYQIPTLILAAEIVTKVPALRIVLAPSSEI